MGQRRNGNAFRKLILDDLKLSRSDPKYINQWARIGRKIEKIPEGYYKLLDEQLESIKKDLKLFIL